MKMREEFLLMLSVFLLLKGTDAETQVVDIDWTGGNGEKNTDGGVEKPDQGGESTGKLQLIMVN